MTAHLPTPVRVILLTAALALAPAFSRAALVQPGQSVRLASSDGAMPGGTVLAEEAAPFFMVMETPGDLMAPTAVPGTLTSTVLRDDATGLLTFVYAVDFAGPGEDGSGGARDASRLSVSAFPSVTTDVAARLAFAQQFTGSRSADGSLLLVESDGPGQGGSPTLVVRTDAKDFNGGGTLTFAAADTVLLPGPIDASGAAGGTTAVLASGRVDLEGVFQPAGGGPAPNPVPLPPAVFTGAGGLMACAMLVLGMRRRVRAA